MAERKAVNKYYPPDWDPAKGSINKHVGQHPLRERARKLSQGILIIRFEMPYNIWCNGCGNHIGMGVRYNAEKKKVGNYYTTPIYRFRMKCHLCDSHMEIETDPKNCDYTIISGARRKEERWDAAATENIQATDHAEKQKLIDDAMYKLEHGEKDKRKLKASVPGLAQIKDIQSQWKDDFGLNQMLRKKFRHEKKVISEKEVKDQELKDKGSLDIELLNENPEDVTMAKRIKFHSSGFREDQRKKRFEIESRSMFKNEALVVDSAKRADLMEKRQKMRIKKSGLVGRPKISPEIAELVKKKNRDITRKEPEESFGQSQNNVHIRTTTSEFSAIDNNPCKNTTPDTGTERIDTRTFETPCDGALHQQKQTADSEKDKSSSLVSEVYLDTDSDNSNA